MGKYYIILRKDSHSEKPANDKCKTKESIRDDWYFRFRIMDEKSEAQRKL